MERDELIAYIIDISNKIANGEIADIDLDVIKSEIDELAYNFEDVIEKFKMVGKNLYESTSEMPVLTQHLEHISETTTKGVIQVMDNAEIIMNSAADLTEKIDSMREKYSGLNEDCEKDLNAVSETAMSIQNSAFGILTSLEFEDINKQQIEKILEALNDFQDKFYKLLVTMKLKSFIDKSDKKDELMNELKNIADIGEEAATKQDLIDELFKEFGL